MNVNINSKKHDLQELRSPEVGELMAYRPHWVIRKWSALFFLIIFITLGLTCIVRYPDIERARMRLVAVNAPRLLVTRAEGKLQKLLVSNGQEVKNGQALAFIQSTANPDQILSLESWLTQTEPFIAKDSFEILLTHPPPQFNELGDVQFSYQDFQNILRETTQVLANGYYVKRNHALAMDLHYLSAMQANVLRQQELLQQDYNLQEVEYNANESLAKDKVISPIELNQNESKVINKEQGLQQVSAQLINNSLTVLGKKKEILDLQKDIVDQQQKFRSALLTLKSKVSDWIQQYEIIASESGKVLFISFLEENELVANGQQLFYVLPTQTQYYGQLMTSQSGFGKIKPGQRVLIRVESYPSSEFGYLTGYINYIPAVPADKDSFLIKVELPKGLVTNYNKAIVFRNNLSAEAEVITDDRRLIERFLGQLKEVSRR